MRYEDKQAIIFLRRYGLTIESISNLLLIPFKFVYVYVKDYEKNVNHGSRDLFWNRPRQKRRNSDSVTERPASVLDTGTER